MPHAIMIYLHSTESAEPEKSSSHAVLSWLGAAWKNSATSCARNRNSFVGGHQLPKMKLSVSYRIGALHTDCFFFTQIQWFIIEFPLAKLKAIIPKIPIELGAAYNDQQVSGGYTVSAMERAISSYDLRVIWKFHGGGAIAQKQPV